MKPILRQLLDHSERGELFALGIITGIKGSSPQKAGAKALFFADGRIVGTVGGGCLEAEIQDRARRALQSGDAATFELVLDHDFGWDDGLICGGLVRGVILPGAARNPGLWRSLVEATQPVSWGVTRDFQICTDDGSSPREWLYRESLHPACRLWMAGSGHVAQAVARWTDTLDFDTTVFDDRGTFASGDYFPTSTRFEIGPWELLLELKPGLGPAMGLILTRGHQRDALVLKHWLGFPFAFLGMIGSRRKWRIISDELSATGCATAAELQRVACPVGLEIGAVSVDEIAVSIVAQLVEKRARLREAQAVATPELKGAT